MKNEVTIQDILANQGFDWPEVFKYAVNPNNLDGVTSRSTFVAADVKRIIAAVNGEPDTENWSMMGQLKDGRYFYLSAGCDYTGWDCQADGAAWVARHLISLLHYIEHNAPREWKRLNGQVL